MRSARRSDEVADEGSASLEFLTVGVLMLVPLVYLVLAVSSVQQTALAVEGAARQAARVYAQQDSLGRAQAAAERAIEAVFVDSGLELDDAVVEVICDPVPTDCLTRRGFVTVAVSTVAPLPLMPPVLVLDAPAGVVVEASATVQVSRFQGSG